MPDPGSGAADDELKKMEKALTKLYKEAAKEMSAKYRQAMRKFREADERKRALVASGDMERADYLEWRKNKLIMNSRINEIADLLAKDLTHTDLIAISTVNEHLPEVYAQNANYAAYEIEHGARIDTNWTLYDRQTVETLMRQDHALLPKPQIDIPKDMQWNQKHMRNAITQGILQGESIPDIAKRLNSVTGMGLTAAIRNARTATTGAQNAGRVASYQRAQKMGIDVLQEWQSAWDSRVRHEHRILDGQRVAPGEKFHVAGETIAFPGDPDCSDRSLIYNCRCTLVAVLPDFDHDSRDGFQYGDMTYEEWKHELEEKSDYAIIDPLREAEKTNPKYSSGKYEYTHNCQRCVPAWEYRMRGHDVEARGCPPYGDFDALASSPFSVWDFSIFSKDENVKAHMDKEGNGKDKIIEFLLRCGNGARVEICVDWEFVQEGHVFSAQNENGKIVFYDPQSGDRGAIVEDYFDRVKIGKTAWLRIDNKEIRQQKEKDVFKNVN